MTVRILHGDCRAMLPTLPAASVQCCVTSPPYFGLRDYGTGTWEGGDDACDHQKVTDKAAAIATSTLVGGKKSTGHLQEGYKTHCGKCGAQRVDQQIGLEQTPDAYVAELVAVFREVRRVLRDDGCVFLNLGDSYAGSQREAAYDRRGKEPVGSPASDCLCGSLCDACRAAYRLGKSHNDSSRVPTLAPSIDVSSLARKGLRRGRLPKSGFPDLGAHNEGAIHGLEHSAGREGAQLPVSQASTHQQSLPQSQGACLQAGSSLECLLCGCSLLDAARGSARSSACTCDTETRLVPSSPGTSGIACSGLAYPDYATKSLLKPKDLIGIPWRVAFALRADGWYLRSDCIWHKPNPMPESVTDRPTKSHEYVFLLTKSARYFWDAEAVKEAATYEGTRGCIVSEARAKAAGRNDGGRKDWTGDGTRNIRTVWTIATTPFSGSHFATMPPDLAERCIKAGSRPGDTVLDPFSGAGTTALVADRLNRNAIGIELNPSYAAMGADRVRDDAPLFAEVT